MEMRQTVRTKGIARHSLWLTLKRDKYLYLLLVIPLAYFVIFKYGSMYGILAAFKDYNIFKGIGDSEWVGLRHFREVFGMKEFFRVVRNTLVLNGLDLLVSFPAPIVLALLITEINNRFFKRFSQTVLYLPHFISWVVIGGIMYQLLSPDSGYVNIIIRQLGGESIPFLTSNSHWVVTYVLIGVWQSAGWGSILYLASITNISPDLYEAAMIDGASRWQQIIHITLPSIRPTIVTMLILNVGKVMTIGFDRPYVIGNTMVREVSDVISTFVYRVGLQSSNYSLATAVGLFQSVIGIVLILLTNMIAKRLGDDGLW